MVTTSGLSAPKLLRRRCMVAAGDSWCPGAVHVGGGCTEYASGVELLLAGYSEQGNQRLTHPSLLMPARHDGGLYTTPKFSCTQYGQDAGSETICVVVGSARFI